MTHPNRPSFQKRLHRHEREIRLWWDGVPVGRFEGVLEVGQWVRPNLFLHPGGVFRFIRADGTVIEMPRMFWDMGSIPGIGRIHPDLTKTGFVHAYGPHDGMFTLNDRAKDAGEVYPFDCDDAADVLAECLKTGEVVGVADLGRIHCEPDIAHLIWTAVRTFPAQQAWDRINPMSLETEL